MPATVNITVENDADFYQTFQYTLADGLTPISIVGWNFNFGIRRSLTDAAVLFYVSSTLSSKGQITIFDGPNGKFTLWIAKAALLAAPAGTWQHSMIGNSPAVTGQPALANVIWGSGSTITINNGPSR